MLHHNSSSDLRAQGSAVVAAVKLTFREKMLAGAIARGIAQTVLHPVDVMRTRLQARNIVSSWKPSVFAKGVIPQITMAFPAGAIQFLAFETAKEKLQAAMPDEKFSQIRSLLAGAFGALCAASCRIPQEVLKQRIQADIYPNIFVAVRETVGKQGIASLYKGSVATISRDVPWNALSFMFHAQGKKMFKASKGRDPANNENLIIAGIAGAVSAVIMTPVDVVKTRIMTQPAGSTVYGGVISTLQKIVREEGAATLMKGVVPRVVFLAPMAGITFSVYEAVAANIKSRKSQSTSVALSPSDESRYNELLQQASGKPRRTTIALRFSKSPVKLAFASSRRLASTIGDYNSPPSFVFSLPM